MPVQLRDLGAVADRHAVAIQVVDQILRHRLVQVAAAVQQRDEGAAPGQPDRGLRGRVAAADHPDLVRRAELALQRTGGVEDADALVVLEPRDGQAPVFGAGGKQHRAGADLDPVFEPDRVPLGSGGERLGAVGRREPSLELARLGDRTTRQFRAADARGKAEVVLDPP